MMHTLIFWFRFAVLAVSLFINGAGLAWAADAPVKTFRDCEDCPDMVAVPGGRFAMGSPGNEEGRYNNEGPVHSVNVAGFAMAKTHVTRGEFAAFVKQTGYRTAGNCFIWSGQWENRQGSNWRDPGFQQSDLHPVVCVNADDAKAYVDWLSRKAGKAYRLPSEAEFEYAARAGSNTARLWGDSPDVACVHANVLDVSAASQVPGLRELPRHDCDDHYAYTAPVASFKPNAFGLYDMAGNAWAWTADCWHDSYSGAPTDGSAWTGGPCGQRVLRGASWLNIPLNVRSADRANSAASHRGANIGFRVVRSLR